MKLFFYFYMECSQGGAWLRAAQSCVANIEAPSAPGSVLKAPLWLHCSLAVGGLQVMSYGLAWFWLSSLLPGCSASLQGVIDPPQPCCSTAGGCWSSAQNLPGETFRHHSPAVSSSHALAPTGASALPPPGKCPCLQWRLGSR